MFLTITMILVTWAVAASEICLSYLVVVKNWTDEAERTAELAAKLSAESFVTADLVLKSMIDWSVEEDIETPEQFREVFSQKRYFTKLRDRINGITLVDVATFIALNGDIVIFSRNDPPGPINLGDRDYFLEQISPDAHEPSLGNVVKNRGTGRWTFYKARRLVSRKGTLVGVVIVGIEAAYFRDFFRRITPDKDSSLSLWRMDGTVLATNSDAEVVLGKTFSDADGKRLLQEHPEGVTQWLTSPRLINGSPNRRRIISVLPVQNEPAFIALTIGEETIFGQWRWDKNVTIGIALVLTALFLWASRQTRRLEFQREHRLRAEEERAILNAIVEMPLALAAVVDRCGYVIRANESFKAVWPNAASVSPFDLAGAAGAEAIVEFAKNDFGPQTIEVCLPTAEHSLRTISFSLSRQTLPQVGTCAVVLGKDDTAQRAAQVAIAQSAKMITLGEMATAMAHELNQPLNIIYMATQNLFAEFEPPELEELPPSEIPVTADFIVEKLETILAQTRRAASLISHMRVFGRAPKEAAVFFDVRDACTAVIGLMGQQMRACGIVVDCCLGDHPALVRGHQTMLEQVIVNLLLNARDALSASNLGQGAEQNEEIKRIAINCGVAGNIVTIDVIDNGQGIRPEIAERIFQPFFTTKPPGQGTGLGLSLAYGIMSDMRGTIRLVPSRRGAHFRIELPAAQAQSLSS